MLDNNVSFFIVIYYLEKHFLLQDDPNSGSTEYLEEAFVDDDDIVNFTDGFATATSTLPKTTILKPEFDLVSILQNFFFYLAGAPGK
jgi:hypothetical protein